MGMGGVQVLIIPVLNHKCMFEEKPTTEHSNKVGIDWEYARKKPHRIKIASIEQDNAFLLTMGDGALPNP
jgi:hypothetical protein